MTPGEVRVIFIVFQILRGSLLVPPLVQETNDDEGHRLSPRGGAKGGANQRLEHSAADQIETHQAEKYQQEAAKAMLGQASAEVFTQGEPGDCGHQKRG